MTLRNKLQTIAIGTFLTAIALLVSVPTQASALDAPWNYTTGAHGSCMGFQDTPDSSGCSYAQGFAPFGSGPHECGYTAPVTQWPVNSDLFAWRDIIIPLAVSKMTFTWNVDNDMDIYLDGVLQVRDRNTFCQTTGTQTITVTPGTHKLAVHAADYGVHSYFDLKYTFS